MLELDSWSRRKSIISRILPNLNRSRSNELYHSRRWRHCVTSRVSLYRFGARKVLAEPLGTVMGTLTRRLPLQLENDLPAWPPAPTTTQPRLIVTSGWTAKANVTFRGPSPPPSVVRIYFDRSKTSVLKSTPTYTLPPLGSGGIYVSFFSRSTMFNIRRSTIDRDMN